MTRLLQWLVTLVAAAAGFAVGVNQSGPAVYRTDIGTVRVDIRTAWPGGLFAVTVPQVGYVGRFHPFRAPIVWRARVLRLDPSARRELLHGGRVEVARVALEGQNVIVRSAARAFAYGAAGAGAAALAVAILFILVFGGVLSRILIAIGSVLPLLLAGVVAFLIAAYGVTP